MEDNSTNSELIIKKLDGFNRLKMDDSDEKIKTTIQGILHLWPDIVAAGDTANEDELFTLNVSRATLTQVFAIVLSKDIFHNDHLLIREIFFSCFNILVKHANIFRDNYSVFINSNVRLLIKMLTSIASTVNFQNGDLSETADKELLIAMREHVDQDSKHDNLTDGIISFIWNLSDRTILVPVLLEAGYASSIVQWIEDRQTKFRDDKLDAPIHILHNLSRHDDGIDQLNTYDAVKVIEGIKFETTTFDDIDNMKLHIAMIRTLLTDIEEIKNDRTNYPNQIVNMLVELSTKAAKNERCRCSGSHVSEPLTVLVKLLYNNDILEDTMSNNTSESSLNAQTIIELFASLLIKFYPKINLDSDILEKYTCVVVFNFFWLISKYEKYRELIGNHTQLMEIVTNADNDEQGFKDTFMPRTMKSIKQTAGDILENLNIHVQF